MTLSIHLTQDWPIERLEPYGKALTHAMRKLCEKYPDDISVKGMMDEITSGKNQLWLILDEEEEFKAFVTSEITTSDITGKKRVTLCDLGGEGGVDLADLIEPIEDWARSIGAVELDPVGRIGWRKSLAKHGYQPIISRYRKVLSQ